MNKDRSWGLYLVRIIMIPIGLLAFIFEVPHDHVMARNNLNMVLSDQTSVIVFKFLL